MHPEQINQTHCPESDEDWELVLNCRKEKNVHFSVLVKRHYELVFNISYRFFLDKQTAEDTAQEVFLTVYQQIDRLKPGVQPFIHWLCRVTSNSCRSMYRKRSSEKKAVEAKKIDFWFPGSAESIEGETSTAERCVNSALQKINPGERMILVLTHIAELKTRDIAKIVNSPEYTIRRRIRRAEEKLRKLIIQQSLRV